MQQRLETAGLMVSVLASNVVDHEFEPWSGQTKDYKLLSMQTINC